CDKCRNKKDVRDAEITALQRRLEDIAAAAFGGRVLTPKLPDGKGWPLEALRSDALDPTLRLRLHLTEQQCEVVYTMETWQAAAEWLHEQGEKA
ncbi:hypothetical protein LCGC14_2813420, partial [marine sediment metagenome]